MTNSELPREECNNHTRLPLNVVENLDSIEDWDDRRALQNRWTLAEKGWLIAVEWKETASYGLGAFAAQDIVAGTPLRHGRVGRNLVPIRNAADLRNFLGDAENKDVYQARVRYLSDYLFGSQLYDGQGRRIPGTEGNDDRLHCVLIPGFGTNHSATPNIGLVPAAEGGLETGVTMIAYRDIAKGEELCNDYGLCGDAPAFVLEFAEAQAIPMSFVFRGCNDYVGVAATEDL
uniref:SET domain-containing protein n=1 Tax=Amphora coffeiformis TaxID=265554 RepID=A0A7S3L5E7_9STRA|mmetsp:Transcript_10332/g.19832  ORF Transcript_10332/g.19832 Transcript_10332/m.19832 type:complete len:232 (-) Transcript_10332:76-771(-)